MADPNKWMGLLRWSMQQQDGTHASEFKAMDPHDREWLERVMKECVIDEIERMHQIIRIWADEDPRQVLPKLIEDPPENPFTPEEIADYKEALLDEMLTRIDQIDNAQTFIKIGGLPSLLSLFQNPRPTTRALAAEVFATCAQNNPPVQKAGLDASIIEALCKMVTEDKDADCRSKALLGISCMVRSLDKTSERWFVVQCDGLGVLTRCLDTGDIRLQRRSLFLLRYLVNASIENAKVLLSTGVYLRVCASLVGGDDVDLNESSLQALSEFASLGPAFKAACKAPALQLVAKIQARLAVIASLEGEEKEYASEEAAFASLVLENLDVLE
ncbi:hypothetical protein SDRG_10366 [Saprolegnia diclina VS20]|uniref:Nucleotide exchange factor Fes1 domain-containing protein n=1 Tax=Saprolegnia diclina (strain VS20) TaxID=1156394 RepID=T0RQ59_SAPDV|nr:hypothetical protein SDRG_10366 [Saprolegnia diclina VS20]EQC32172.1 hypothetical protein SDRG_10366 [Saprolegnia diclina VS20]|eukprot:XP_008614574.1 hypothetical protein SDRG_10366 [Saprolegnia diclina VS20]